MKNLVQTLFLWILLKMYPEALQMKYYINISIKYT